MTKKLIKYSLIGCTAAALMTGCSYKAFKTPAVMSFDGDKVDYTKIDEMKKAKVCQLLTEGDGDSTVILAAKKAGISHIEHVDTSFEYDQFLFWRYNVKSCVVVYGE